MDGSRFSTAHGLIVAVAVGGAFFLAGKHIDRQPVPIAPGTITVTGEGKVSVAPDIAEMSFGVTTGVKATSKEASASITKSMNEVLAAVKALGIEDKDIRTESFYLNPSYDWNDGRQRLRGYEATQSLRVKVRDLAKVGDVLTAATEAGANQAGGVEFTLEDPDAKQTEARTEAIADAKGKAEALAAQLGEKLGDVQSFNENGGGWYPRPMMMAKAEYSMGGAPMDDEAMAMPAGEEDITISVSITYELR